MLAVKEGGVLPEPCDRSGLRARNDPTGNEGTERRRGERGQVAGHRQEGTKEEMDV